jgi:hypothetical protein
MKHSQAGKSCIFDVLNKLDIKKPWDVISGRLNMPDELMIIDKFIKKHEATENMILQKKWYI